MQAEAAVVRLWVQRKLEQHSSALKSKLTAERGAHLRKLAVCVCVCVYADVC
jgi:hypothetical protein